MSDAAARRIIAVSFLGAVAIAAWYWIDREKVAPPPSAFLGAGMVYAPFAIGAEVAPALFAALSVAWTLGLLYRATETSTIGFGPFTRTVPARLPGQALAQVRS